MLEVGIHRRQIDDEKVFRHRVERVLETLRARAAAVQERLVVSRDHSGGGVVGVDDLEGVEVELEERRDVALARSRGEGLHARANALPRVLLLEHAAAARERFERGSEALASPRGQVGPRCRDELAAIFDRRDRRDRRNGRGRRRAHRLFGGRARQRVGLAHGCGRASREESRERQSA